MEKKEKPWYRNNTYLVLAILFCKSLAIYMIYKRITTDDSG